MSKNGLTITTKNAIINSQYTFIKNKEPYRLTRAASRSLDDAEFLRATFRRFMRLRPFVSNRAMVRETYTDYVHYKYRDEKYILKRSLVLDEHKPIDATEDFSRIEILNTLDFVFKASCFIPEGPSVKYQSARDNTMCRQILKNILTAEYEKGKNIRKLPISPQYTFRKKLEHLKYSNDYIEETMGKINEKGKLKADSMIKQYLYGEFDRNLILLNELIKTRL
ncbi:Increased recombination centers protein 19 [Nakaseomyces bracarensis]|uniref:Increased recombination centers protein 19 n=1 Tax=Nakaseomyces bracarensis TaxID=273131 RepID=A0ABR4NTQ2_9SACH